MTMFSERKVRIPPANASLTIWVFPGQMASNPIRQLSRALEKFMKLMENTKIQAIVEKMAPKE